MIKKIVSNEYTALIVSLDDYPKAYGTNLMYQPTKQDLFTAYKNLKKAVLKDSPKVEKIDKYDIAKSFIIERVGNKEFITLDELISLQKACKNNLVYSYDLLGTLYDFKQTRKGLRAADSLGNRVYFYNRDNYKFYIDCFTF